MEEVVVVRGGPPWVLARSFDPIRLLGDSCMYSIAGVAAIYFSSMQIPDRDRHRCERGAMPCPD